MKNGSNAKQDKIIHLKAKGQVAATKHKQHTQNKIPH